MYIFCHCSHNLPPWGTSVLPHSATFQPQELSMLYNAHNLCHVSLSIRHNYPMIRWSSAPLDGPYISSTGAIMVYVMLPECTWWLKIEYWMCNCRMIPMHHILYLAGRLCSSIYDRICSPCTMGVFSYILKWTVSCLSNKQWNTFMYVYIQFSITLLNGIRRYSFASLIHTM